MIVRGPVKPTPALPPALHCPPDHTGGPLGPLMTAEEPSYHQQRVTTIGVCGMTSERVPDPCVLHVVSNTVGIIGHTFPVFACCYLQ